MCGCWGEGSWHPSNGPCVFPVRGWAGAQLPCSACVGRAGRRCRPWLGLRTGVWNCAHPCRAPLQAGHQQLARLAADRQAAQQELALAQRRAAYAEQLAATRDAEARQLFEALEVSQREAHLYFCVRLRARVGGSRPWAVRMDGGRRGRPWPHFQLSVGQLPPNLHRSRCGSSIAVYRRLPRRSRMSWQRALQR